MKKVIVILGILLLSISYLNAHTTLSAGDIAITGVNMDNPDQISVVFLVDIESGTEIKFTDNGWKSDNSWRTGEGIHTWTASSAYTAGDEIVIDLSGPQLSGDGDQVIAYQNTSDMIGAINDDGDHVWQSDATSSNTSALPQGLTNGTNCVALTETDNIKYDRSVTEGTKGEILSAINDYTKWSGSNTVRQTLSTAGFTISDGGPNSPTSFNVTNIQNTQFNITWTKPSGTHASDGTEDWSGVIVFVSQGSSDIDLSKTGQDGSDYTASTTYGNGTRAKDSGGKADLNAYCIANQTTDSDGNITVTGLSENTSYYIYAWTYNVVAGDTDNDDWSGKVTYPDSRSDIVNEDFSSDPVSGGNWTTYNVSGTQVWTYDASGYMEMNGYSGGANANEDWLISPGMNLNNYDEELLSFTTAEGYSGTDLVVYYSTDYVTSNNPNSYSWTEITTLTSGGTTSDLTDLDDVSGTNVFVGFKYESDDVSNSEWRVSDFSVTGYDVPTTLPVTLSTFTAQYLDSKPTLYWSTQSETDNMGWFIYRNSIEDFTSAEKITGMIEGHGTTTQQQNYIYADAEDLQVEQTYFYWLESVDYSGTIHHYDRVAQITIPHPDDPGQNVTPPVAYDISADPNPFSHSTEITFAIDQISRIDVTIYNVKGQMVKSFGTVMTNADEEVSFQWNGKDNSGKALSNGVYLYSVKVNGKDYATRQLILMK